MAKSQREATARPLGVGIVGAGLMGRWHAEAARAAGARVVGIADTNARAASMLAARFRTSKSYASLDELLQDQDIDVLHVCTPLDSHVRLALAGLEAGAHVFVEKPLAPSSSDTEIVLRSAREKHRIVSVAHQFPFQEGALRAVELVPKIGPVVSLEATMVSAGGAGRARHELDAIVADILPHPLSLFRRFVPDDPLDGDWHVLKPQAGELRVLCQRSDTVLSLAISLAARPPVNEFRVVGRGGTIYLDLFHGYSIVEPDRVSRFRKAMRPFDLAARLALGASLNLGRRAARGEPAYPGLFRLIQAFHESVKCGAPAPIPPGEIVEIAKCRDAILGSVCPTSPRRAPGGSNSGDS